MQFLLIKKYINEEEVQRILGVCQRTVYNYIKSGQLIATYIGSKKHFDILDIHEGLHDNKGKGRGGGRKWFFNCNFLIVNCEWLINQIEITTSIVW